MFWACEWGRHCSGATAGVATREPCKRSGRVTSRMCRRASRGCGASRWVRKGPGHRPAFRLALRCRRRVGLSGGDCASPDQKRKKNLAASSCAQLQPRSAQLQPRSAASAAAPCRCPLSCASCSSIASLSPLALLLKCTARSGWSGSQSSWVTMLTSSWLRSRRRHAASAAAPLALAVRGAMGLVSGGEDWPELVSGKGCYDGFIPPDTSDSTSSTLLTAAMCRSWSK